MYGLYATLYLSLRATRLRHPSASPAVHLNLRIHHITKLAFNTHPQM